jgi:hypothetical protein
MNGTSKVSIITGGGQGIGKAIAQRFLQEGMAVVLAESDEEAGREAQAELAAHGTVQFVPTDVASESDVQALLAATLARFGRVDSLINNAGISRNIPLANLTMADWSRVLAINLTGPLLCAKYAAPHLRQTHGAIVNIASTRALMSEPHTEAYSASKGGLVSLTHALALSLAPVVRVNCISPGWIEVSAWKKRAARAEPTVSDQDHAQHPAGRVGRPEDVAGLTHYLVSDEAGFVTGQNFVIDGGMTKKMIYA